MDTEAILEILGIVFAAGMFYAKMESISKDIRRLEKAQTKYNQMQERLYTLELWKDYHEREHNKNA